MISLLYPQVLEKRQVFSINIRRCRSITITFDAFGVYIKDGNKTKQETYDKFIHKINLLREQTQSIEVLPLNTLATRRVGVTHHIALNFPACIRTVCFDKRNYTVPVPNTVIITSYMAVDSNKYGYKNIRLDSPKLYVTPTPISSYDDFLYDIPFGNAYTKEGTICWGETNIPAGFTNLGSLNSFYDIYFDSGFNTDLEALLDPIGMKKYNTNNLRDLYCFLDGKATFPIELLSRTNTTLRAAMTLISDI